MEFMELWKLAGPLMAIGGAWGGAKVALNGTRERVKVVEHTIRQHIADEHEHDMKHAERLSAVETKIDILIDKVK